MKRTVNSATKYAIVTLKIGGPRSYALPTIGSFEAGKPRTIGKHDQIQSCLNVSKFRVEEFDAQGAKVADTEAEVSVIKITPKSVAKASDAKPKPQKPQAPKAKPDEKLEDSEILADTFGGDNGKWDPSMGRARLLSILGAKQGQQPAKTMSKAEIITALELLDKPDAPATEPTEKEPDHA